MTAFVHELVEFYFNYKEKIKNAVYKPDAIIASICYL